MERESPSWYNINDYTNQVADFDKRASNLNLEHTSISVYNFMFSLFKFQL